MSKVISFSISDRYLDKLRSLYPALTDNLAAKQFLTDGLESSLSSSLDVSLDDSLDDKLKSLIESELDGILEGRLDAAVGKLITSLSERMARLEARLDDSLDGSLDDMEPLLKREKECSIAAPIPTGETSPGSSNQPAIETGEVSPSPPDAIGTLPTFEAVESISSINEPVKGAIETDDREWLTLQQIADKKIKGLPGTQQGLRLHAKNWESRKNPQKRGEQYKIPKEYLTPISPNPD